jgi:ATP-dependent exoDNAse (exonuclease V) alpha subunit
MRACQEPRPSARPCSVASRLCAPSPDLKLANRELGTVEGIGQDGRMRFEDGRRPSRGAVELYPATHPHLDHGYAVTSHSSQGQTADRVLINVDTELGAKDLLNNRMAYVKRSYARPEAAAA